MCHGKDARGKKSQKAPSLAGQHDWYIKSQIEAFQTKKRKNPIMMPFIRNLKEQDIADLGAYLQSLWPTNDTNK